MNNEYDYPMNLLSDIFSGDEEIIENIDTISDLNASVEYVLFRLTDRERKIIERRYKNNQTYNKKSDTPILVNNEWVKNKYLDRRSIDEMIEITRGKII